MTGQSRWVPLEGAVNVRDLGGLPTAEGAETARGRVLRSDNLQGLTAADVRRLVDDLGVRTVVDLRTTVEVDKEGPGPLTREPRVVHLHHSLFPEGGHLTDVGADALLPWRTDAGRAGAGDEYRDDPSVGYYLGYLRDRPDSIVAALRAMAAADGGVTVVHCAAGKDRTGVVVALALSVVGVTRPAVVADYVATSDRLDAVLDRLRATDTYLADLDDEPTYVHRPRAATMERFLGVLDERFGGPLGWLESAGFGAGDVAALRARLLG
jgi:protein tyrosine/serine phosphatase